MNKLTISYFLSALIILISILMLMWAQDDSSYVDNQHFEKIRNVAYGLLTIGIVSFLVTFILHMRY